MDDINTLLYVAVTKLEPTIIKKYYHGGVIFKINFDRDLVIMITKLISDDYYSTNKGEIVYFTFSKGVFAKKYRFNPCIVVTQQLYEKIDYLYYLQKMTSMTQKEKKQKEQKENIQLLTEALKKLLKEKDE